jgi:hypothetical protein
MVFRGSMVVFKVKKSIPETQKTILIATAEFLIFFAKQPDKTSLYTL